MNGHPVEKLNCLVSSCTAGNNGEETPIDANENRRRLSETLNIEYNSIVFLKQIHSRKTVEADNVNHYGGETEGDGLITLDRKLFLSVTVADCLPVYLYDTESQAAGLLHSGWKGTGIVNNALELMREKWKTRAEAVAAVLGPCIRSCCYKVNRERAAAFEAEFGGASGEYPLGPVTSTRDGGYYLDLQAANARLLANAGVRNIAVCENCTFTDTRMGSFRREGANYSRMIAMVGDFSG